MRSVVFGMQDPRDGMRDDSPVRVFSPLPSARGICRTPHLSAFTLFEGLILVTSVVLVTWLGGVFQRWIFGAAGLHSHPASIQELTTIMQSMPFQARATHHVFELRVDAPHRNFQLVAIEQRRNGAVELVQQTVWLPEELEITEAPTMIRALPTGQVSSGLIVIAAPAQNRLFRLTMSNGGVVELHEEPTS